MEQLTLARYEAQGNDFLIALLTGQEQRDLDATLVAHGLTRPDVARVACDRRLGVGSRRGYVYSKGADGFLVGMHGSANGRGTGSLRMHLLNADGSFAEVSGNGLASLAFAAFDAGVVPGGSIPFETDAGTHHCNIHSNDISSKDRPGVKAIFVEVAMKSVVVGSPAVPPGLMDRIRRDLSGDVAYIGSGHVGNPHLVIALQGPIDANRTAEFGAAYEKFFPGGINVEFIWLQRDGSGGNELAMGVWERGVGLTHSCGTGSVVAATLARHWAIVPDESVVRMVTVPQGWEFGENAGNGKRFGYSVMIDPPPKLCVMAERIETGITLRLDRVPALLADLNAMDTTLRR